jgi:hypothetical protein
MSPSTFPLAWEQVHWRTRRFAVSDFRLVALERGRVRAEIALHDVRAISIEPSILGHITGIGMLVVRSARADDPLVRIGRVRAARRAALRLNLLIGDLRGLPPDDGLAGLPLPRIWRIPSSGRLQGALIGPAAMLLTLGAVVIGLSGYEKDVAYGDDDAVRPRGVAKPREEIVAFMEREVMPFAREALGPVVGGADKVRCETCHGSNPEARQWRMPAVEVLPEPDVRRMPAAGSDSQVRNALHGYLAEEDKQPIAARMRGVVVPGMARLLHRPAYNFAQTYEYNRARAAFGCYHCHMVAP